MPINLNAKLNPKLFDADVEQMPTRDGYGEGLLLAGDANQNVVALCADLTESTRTEAFAKKYPERFFEVGVAEQNLATIAAGLGISGKIPFISSYAAFSPGRNWEQIRTTISYNDSNVKIAGAHTGISVGPDGATHQATEDVATMRVMANMKVFMPCDAIEAKKATLAAAKIWGPVYLRFAREKSPVITTEATSYVPGRADVFWDASAPSTRSGQVSSAPNRGSMCLIIACGSLMYNALLAARALEREKIKVTVLNVHTIKPLNEKKIISLVKSAKAVVTVEEHQVAGGLGGAVAELLAKHAPVPMEFIGMQDVFGESGKPAELLEKYNMTPNDIIRAVKKVIKRKK